ncbi:density-regulated protein DRP1 [Calocera viscosa TUFC12733]|uniref:Translation machinery-associated protein 22 n=1 Tax=Calocera viscosa (strain TUFC12733) TaxID=1330018 RepID=A0A167QTX8_CALVF|nr:density-regulated protein DRP1 [Calocera viscosa TUFC12733]
MADTAGPSEPPVKPIEVLYCEVCSFPPEYCEFGSSVSKCKQWLEKEHPDLYEKYWSDEALVKKIGTLSVENQKKLDVDSAKKEAKAEAKASAAEKKRKESKITIKRVERNKRKHVTSVQGLEAFGVDLKKASKLFAQKFATGSSVSKNLQGLEEIVVQGDVTEEIIDMIVDQVGVLKGVPEKNIIKIEEKKKKGGDDE